MHAEMKRQREKSASEQKSTHAQEEKSKGKQRRRKQTAKLERICTGANSQRTHREEKECS